MNQIDFDFSTFAELLEPFGVKEDAITRIYSGKDHACRCGCKGTYYDKGEKSYAQVLGNLKAAIANGDVRKEEVVSDAFPNGDLEYINIPTGNVETDHCYTLYFD